MPVIFLGKGKVHYTCLFVFPVALFGYDNIIVLSRRVSVCLIKYVYPNY